MRGREEEGEKGRERERERRMKGKRKTLSHLVINTAVIHSKKSLVCSFFGLKLHKAVRISRRTLKKKKTCTEKRLIRKIK